MNAKHIETETIDGVTRDWYDVTFDEEHDAFDGEYALITTDKETAVLDRDGVQVVEYHIHRMVERAIEARLD